MKALHRRLGLPNAVDIESGICVIKALTDHDLAFKDVVFFGLSQVELDLVNLGRAVFVPNVEKTSCIRRQVSFIASKVDNSA
jgi:hypothetical protein